MSGRPKLTQSFLELFRVVANQIEQLRDGVFGNLDHMYSAVGEGSTYLFSDADDARGVGAFIWDSDGVGLDWTPCNHICSGTVSG